MSQFRINIQPNQLLNIQLDDQHISRVTEHEARDLILQILVFGGKKLRDEIHGWLNEGTPQKIAEVLSPEAQEEKQ